MRLPALRLLARLIFTGTFFLCAPAQAQERHPEGDERRPRFWQAVSGVAAVNGLTWFYNWHVQHWDWADVGTRSWWANLRHGFSWDDDVFGANQAAHPYHGSLYFNAARASGYDFWGSAPFVAAGSLSWELFTENVRPSLNDLITTTLGGIALGEVSYRMSSLLTSSGGAAAGRKMGAFMLSPMARTHSLVYGTGRGSSSTVPVSSSALLSVGQRRRPGPSTGGVTGSRPFIGLSVQYGSAFDEHIHRPYDAFELSLHLSPNEAVVLTHASVTGILARHHLARTTGTQLLLGMFQHYDYDDLPFVKASSQSLSGALLYQSSSARTQLDLGLHLELVPLGAVSSDHELVRRRDYDFGPGIGARFSGALRRDGRELLRVEGRRAWIHSLYAADADHLITTGRVSAAVPLMRVVSVGGDASLTLRRSWYRSQAPTSRRVPQFRAYLILSPS